MRTIQTIASTRIDHGGTSRSVPALCNAIAKCEIDNYLITAVPADPSIPCNLPTDRTRVLLAKESKWIRQLGVGHQFCNLLRKLIKNPSETIVHDHAVWLPTNHAVAKFCSRENICRIVSPRGMLGSWAMTHGKWKKKLAWRLFQYRDLLSASGFHATSSQEADEIRSLGFQQPIAVVPNGIDYPLDWPSRTPYRTVRQALFLSRIHPKKGISLLLEAWKAAELPADWRLAIAGPDEGGYQAKMEAEATRLGIDRDVQFLGPIDDANKWQLYVDSDLFVLPSFNENFGIVIAEAMAAGLPVITTTGTPWQVLQEKHMGWWIQPDLRELTAALKKAASLSTEVLANMGSHGKDYVTANFSWKKSAEMLAEFYERLLANRRGMGR